MRRDLVHGFTLVELVSVIAVTSILAATAVPRIASNETFNTRGDTGLVVSTVRYAQKTAIAQHRNVFVVVNGRNLRLCYDAGCTATVTDPVTNAAYNQNVNATVNVVVSDSDLGFDSVGLPIPNNANATYTVSNSTNAAQTTTIQVEQDTGYVREL